MITGLIKQNYLLLNLIHSYSFVEITLKFLLPIKNFVSYLAKAMYTYNMPLCDDFKIKKL